MYLGVNDGRFYEREDFVMNAESGVISRNDDFDGEMHWSLATPLSIWKPLNCWKMGISRCGFLNMR